MKRQEGGVWTSFAYLVSSYCQLQRHWFLTPLASNNELIFISTRKAGGSMQGSSKFTCHKFLKWKCTKPLTCSNNLIRYLICIRISSIGPQIDYDKLGWYSITKFTNCYELITLICIAKLHLIDTKIKTPACTWKDKWRSSFNEPGNHNFKQTP